MFSSCRKDYVCTCDIKIKIPRLSFDSTSISGISDTTYKIAFDIDGAKKKEAKNKCAGAEDGYKAFPLIGLLGSVDCTLD